MKEIKYVVVVDGKKILRKFEGSRAERRRFIRQNKLRKVQ